MTTDTPAPLLSAFVTGTLTPWLEQIGIGETGVVIARMTILFTALLLLAIIVNLIARRILLRVITHWVRSTENKWDDVLVDQHVFDALSHIAPAIAISLLAETAFMDVPNWIPVVLKLTDLYYVVISLIVLNNALNATRLILKSLPALSTKPVSSFVQLLKIAIFLIGGIIALSMLLGKSPVYFLSGLGAMTAVLLLIFKDTILGFVGSIQISANDMVRVGDWVEMPKYGADGDVTEMNLATIKIQNWDRTITTVPTYAFISDSFKNWRGMSESGGRRIMRAIHIKISSIRFCDDDMLKRFSGVQLLQDYIQTRRAEIDAHNRDRRVDKSQLINGRHMTNIGVFRHYIEKYLHHHPDIHSDMICMVRQLTPRETGIPIEVYAFSRRQEWVIYEGIQADIFDHLLAAVPTFELEVFEEPSGSDFQKLMSRPTGD